jgi:MFS family permease
MLHLHMLAQDVDIKLLNNNRIQTNKAGMFVLGSWGAANIAGGLAGYAIADNAEWQSFHAMNAVWGAVNGLIAVGGYIGAKRELTLDYSMDEAYDKYKSSKRLYLINAGLDVLYIGTGAALMAYAPGFRKPQMWSGFGKSIAFQGIALLVFDGVMYGAHQGKNRKWIKALGGLGMTSDGIGYIYRF